MSRRATLAGILVALGFGAGCAVGIVVEHQWRLTSMASHWKWQQIQRQRQREYARRELAPEQLRLDSLARERAQHRDRMPPIEVSRVQTGAHCAVSFEMRDTMFRNLPLFRAEARDPQVPAAARGEPNAVVALAEGYAYRKDGWDRGDTATVVLPEVWCGGLGVVLWSGMAIVPPRPIGVDQR